jgi:hypothetical protein
MPIAYEWRGDFESPEINLLHAEGFGHDVLDDDWRGQVERHSLGWVCARESGTLARRRVRRAASGCMWTSRTSFGPSTSTPAGLLRPTPG